MKVEAELKTLYKITVGDDGICMGQYYAEDDWEESYYGEDLKEIAEKMSIEYFNGLPRRKFYFSENEVLIYNGRKYDQKTIREYNSYKKDSDELKKEYNEFMQYWNELEPDRKKMQEVQKAKEERKKKLDEIKKNEEKSAKELAEYLKLKEKFEKIN
jgi:hypothetical protein